jgi:hypothetical protein
VAARVPALPCVSSLFLESASAFTVTASVQARRGQGPPPVPVPVLTLADLARPGDGVRVGPIVTDPSTQGTFTVTVPGIDEDALPFRMFLVFRDGQGRELRRLNESLWGASMLADQPWDKYALPRDVPFDLEVRFLSARRPPRGGLWVHGIARERTTGASRFIPGRVERGGAR